VAADQLLEGARLPLLQRRDESLVIGSVVARFSGWGRRDNAENPIHASSSIRQGRMAAQ